MNEIINETNEQTEVVEEVALPVMEETAVKKKMPFQKLALLISMGCSMIILILGILTATGAFFNGDTSGVSPVGASTDATSYNYYGGDAYTGIQHAAADASNNAAVAAENVATSNQYLSAIELNMIASARANQSAMGFLLIALGLMSGCYFGVKFAGYVAENA